MTHVKKFQPGQGRSNTGHIVLYAYTIWASIEDDSEPQGWVYHPMDMELSGTVKLTTIAVKVKKAIEMSGYTQTQDYLEIIKGEALPDSRTDKWRV